ncbi:GDSL esterase/lipase At3g14820 [Vigna radiata var. radiata]|uniref:GDSL esterase/lipase At3g14820 n=1 Tax=Vigna radiata var. radiata TaxID=3916 RepID=A0A3Q0F0Y0_VIGRR|nr:GDSL esterase/lipase At3g14820 [Vigna radiata var. radiata]
MELWNVVFVWCVLRLGFLHHTEAIVKLRGNETIPALILFGDSIVDTGANNNLITAFKSNFPPYGRDFHAAQPTGRFSNGKVPSDFVAEELGINEYSVTYTSPNLQPDDLLKGINFASGGAGYDPFTAQLASVVPLSEQLEQFKEYIGKLKANFGEAKTNFILSKSLVLVVSSSNDIANTYFASGIRKLDYDVPSYTDVLVQLASSFVKELYGLGVRRMGVFGAPPLGCLPFMRTMFGGLERKCREEINMASKLFNSKISSELHKLHQNWPQAKIVYINIYDPLLNIIQNPMKYGLEVVDRGCCGTGSVEAGILCNPLDLQTCTDDSKYVFWDSYHPTQRTYQILVGEILNKYVNNFS